MTAVQATAIVLLAGVTAYAVFGGADFGAGFWDLVAGRTETGLVPRALIADAIGPVWEANHTWLIFDLVILWTAFPPAFAAIMTTLFVPLCLVAVGMVLRGAAFAFRPVATGLRGRRAAGAVFAISSIMTPFLLGAVVGAIASGRVIAAAGPELASDPWTVWLNPTSMLLGAMAVAVCAYLAAVFLVADARRRSDDALVDYFRRRAMAAGVVAGGLAIGAIPVLAVDAPVLAAELTARGWPLVVASGVLGADGTGAALARPTARHQSLCRGRRRRGARGLGRRAISVHPAADDDLRRRRGAGRLAGGAPGHLRGRGAGDRALAGPALQPRPAGPAERTRGRNRCRRRIGPNADVRVMRTGCGDSTADHNRPPT